jgi:hypothetical protein
MMDCTHGLAEGDCAEAVCKTAAIKRWEEVLGRTQIAGHEPLRCCRGCRHRIEQLERRLQELDLLCNQLRRLG